MSDYYQNGFPVLSFLYALYTDQAFSQSEHATWAGNHAYTGYLANYQPFPANVQTVVSTDVPNNGANSTGFYFPTPNQAWVGINEIFREITTAPPAPRPGTDPRSIAQLGGDRPVLRILAVLFLNQPGDPVGNINAAINALSVGPGVKATLSRLVGQKPAVLSNAESMDLGNALVDEFIAAPPQW